MTPDIVGLGCVAVDDFIYTQTATVPGGKCRVVGRDRQIGGLTALALQAAARLGARCSFEGLLSSAPRWSFVDEALALAEVETAAAPRGADIAPVQSVIAVAPDGERTVYFDDSSPAGPPDDPDLSRLAGAKVLFVDGHGVPGAIVAAHAARAAGIAVVGDCETVQHDRLGELLDAVDHLILPVGFAMTLTRTRTPDDAVRSLGRANRALVAVTDGVRGVRYQTPEHGDDVRFLPAFVVETVDTTGCGDVFHGAYAAALTFDLRPPAALRFAAATSAILASRRSGPDRLPTRPEVEHFLARCSQGE